MLAKDERKAMLLRLFNDDTPLKDRSKERLAATAAAGAVDTQEKTDPYLLSTAISTLRGTTAERAKVHYPTAKELADEFPEGEEEEEEEADVPIDENGADGAEEERKIRGEEGEEGDGKVEQEQESGELDVGGGEGIMRIGGRD